MGVEIVDPVSVDVPPPDPEPNPCALVLDLNLALDMALREMAEKQRRMELAESRNDDAENFFVAHAASASKTVFHESAGIPGNVAAIFAASFAFGISCPFSIRLI